MMFTRAGTCCTGVVVVHVPAMHVAIIPDFEMLDGVCCHSVGSGSAAAAAKATAVEAAATAAAAAAAAVAVAIPVAATATIVA